MTLSDIQVRERLLSLVVPIYNDETCVAPFWERMQPVLEEVRSRFDFEAEILFVMDPSTDGTEQAIRALHDQNPAVKLIKLSRRFGQQPAILTGLFHCAGSAAVVMDVDLQDPPELIYEMLAQHLEKGFNVVNAQRTKRAAEEPRLRRGLAEFGYWLMNRISDVDIPQNVGDYRLVDRRVIEELRKLKETHSFFRGLVPFVGFKQTNVPFERQNRVAGKSKYAPVVGSIANGVNALVCFSNKLLSLAGVAGALMFLACLVALYYLIYFKFFSSGQIETGFFFLALVLLLVASVQSLLLAVLGAYVGRIYDEVKRRPIAIVDEKVGFEEVRA